VLAVFRGTGTFKTTTYTSLTQNSSYLLGAIWAAVAEKNGVAAEAESSIEEKEVLAAPETERDELRKARIGQGRYRRRLIKLRRRCYVSGVAMETLLRASHIRPWAKCEGNLERVDPHNGLLLTPNFDALFNDGLISFEDDGSILVSETLPREVAEAFKVDHRFKGADLGEATKAYLAYHRAEVFTHPAATGDAKT